MGALIACFRRGPVRIGVMGFPVAGLDWDLMPDTQLTAAAQDVCKLARLDLLRVNRSMMIDLDPGATLARPDAWVGDLTRWNPNNSRRLRKDLAFAHRANPSLQILPRCVDPDVCYRLYASTIRSRRGNLRYSASYFRSLVHVAEGTNLLRHFTAVDADGTIRGFAVLAMHAGCVYYLHGGSDEKGKREGVTDLLLAVMVRESAGCARFNLMASPWDQPGLSRFKHKWSDHRGLAVTSDFAGSLMGKAARQVLRWRSRHEREAARAAGEDPVEP